MKSSSYETTWVIIQTDRKNRTSKDGGPETQTPIPRPQNAVYGKEFMVVNPIHCWSIDLGNHIEHIYIYIYTYNYIYISMSCFNDWFDSNCWPWLVVLTHPKKSSFAISSYFIQSSQVLMKSESYRHYIHYEAATSGEAAGMTRNKPTEAQQLRSRSNNKVILL